MNRPQRTWLRLLPIALLCTACGALDAASSVASDPFGEGQARAAQPAVQPNNTGWEQGTQRPGAVLYARDGSPVGQAPQQQPNITRTDSMPRGLEKSGGSRLVLLDLYQQAVDERDELLLELEATREMLNAAEDRIQGLELQKTGMQTQLDAVSAERQALELTNFEMADRLATSELRRLEAEERYLQTAIAARKEAGNQ